MSDSAGRAENAMNAIWRFLLRLVVIALIIFAFYRLRNVITTLFIAAIIAYVLEWPIDWLCRQQGFIWFHAVLSNRISALQLAIRRIAYRREDPPAEKVRIHRHVLRVYATLYVMIFAAIVIWRGTGFVIRPFVNEVKQATTKDPITGKSPLQVSWEDGLDRYDSIPNLPEPLKSKNLMSQIKSSNI